jgi:antirestriction protein
MNNQAFFYIDGIPTKGTWIDMDDITEWEQVKEQLASHFKIDADGIDEVLCSDIEGLPRHFYASNCDGFSMNDWADFKEQLEATHLDEEIIDAYLDNMGTYGGIDVSNIEDSYYGEFESFTDLAYHLMEETGDLDQIPENLRSYFDYEKFGDDLSFDFFESNGYYFRNC